MIINAEIKGQLVFAEHLRRKNEINQKFSKENDKKCNKSRNFVHNVGSYHKKTCQEDKDTTPLKR